MRIGSATPDSSSTIPAYKYGTRYTDRPVAPGSSYTYAVVAISRTGQASPKSTSVKATSPRQTTPLITIATDSSDDPSLASWLTQIVKPEVGLWYQKISDILAYPRYTPSLRVSLVIDRSLTITAQTSGSTIRLSPTYFKAHPDDIGAIIHEAAHVVSDISTYQKWEHESIADWIRLNYYRDPKLGAAPLQLHSLYDQGYLPGAHLLNYIHVKGHPTFVKDLNTAIHSKAYSTNYIRSKTGKTPNAWWASMTDTWVRSGRLAVKIKPSLCVDLPYSNTTYGTDLQLYACNGTPAQKITSVTTSRGITSLRLLGACVDVESSGKVPGTPVQYWGCNGSPAQTWKLQPDGKLVNTNSGKCLAPQTVSSGAKLIISNCSSSPAQQWATGDS